MKYFAKVVPMSGLMLVLCCLGSAWRASVGHAYPYGIAGRTTKTLGPTGMGCANCHGGDSSATVAISGPSSLLVGATGIYPYGQ